MPLDRKTCRNCQDYTAFYVQLGYCVYCETCHQHILNHNATALAMRAQRRIRMEVKSYSAVDQAANSSRKVGELSRILERIPKEQINDIEIRVCFDGAPAGVFHLDGTENNSPADLKPELTALLEKFLAHLKQDVRDWLEYAYKGDEA